MIEIKYKRKPDALLNMTPMIDIVFLLLIFFLLTTNFITQEGINVNLPNARATGAQTQEEITIHITREGRVFIKNEEVNEAELYKTLKSLIRNDPGKPLTIRADKDVVLDAVVKVMDTAKSSGAQKLFIATERDF
ncbi:MAG: ExbD/TolR family protein [bacterium]